MKNSDLVVCLSSVRNFIKIDDLQDSYVYRRHHVSAVSRITRDLGPTRLGLEQCHCNFNSLPPQYAKILRGLPRTRLKILFYTN